MDSIIEYMVKKEKESSDTVKKVLLIIAAVVVSLLSLYFLKGFGLLGAAAAIFVAYRLITALELEYEYCVIDSDIVVDKILNRSRRKKYISLEGKNIDVIGPVNSDKVKDALRPGTKVYYCAAKKNDPENYAIVGACKNGHIKLIIQMNDRMKEQFKRTMPRKFFDQ